MIGYIGADLQSWMYVFSAFYLPSVVFWFGFCFNWKGHILKLFLSAGYKCCANGTNVAEALRTNK